MITGGFGTTIDLQTGRQRNWYIGRDGVKRWADNDQPTVKESLTAADHLRGAAQMMQAQPDEAQP